jgi:hypothetical protein
MEFPESVKLGGLQNLGGFLTFPAPDSTKNQATTIRLPRSLSMKSALRMHGTACTVQLAGYKLVGKVAGRETWYHDALNALLVVNVVAWWMSIRF